jgi:peptidoglycan/LPS O-acetylase OafA/YrhL
MLNRRFDNIDVLRAIAAFGIVMVHVLKNVEFTAMPVNAVYNFISSFFLLKMERFVSLFFLISGFAVSCGYYNKIKNGEISIGDFYTRRFSKVLPLFVVIVLIESVYLLVFRLMNFHDVIIESIADISLFYAFLPFSSISIVGVGWALGVIFSFYLLFPFIVFCTWTKKRSWLSLIVAIFLSYSARTYFTYDGVFSNCNITLWIHYFIAGVIIFLYKEYLSSLLEKYRFVYIPLILLGFLLSFCVLSDNVLVENIKNMIAWSLVIVSSLGKNWKLSETKVIKKCSQYSFDIYLIHMLILRTLQLIKLPTNIGLLSLLLYTILVFSIAFFIAFLFGVFMKKLSTIKKRK